MVLDMSPIYAERGQVVAWLASEDIYDLKGDHLAVVLGEDVHGHQGQHLGIFRHGLFRDHNGAVVAFTYGASGGPAKPITRIPPVAPIRSLPPPNAVPQTPRLQAISQSNWGLTWETFIHQ